MPRLFFTTDIHGSDRCWRKLVNAGDFYDAEILVLGGDIAGKAVFLIERDREDGAWHASRGGRDFVARNDDELAALIEQTRDAGFYPYAAEPDDAAEFRASQDVRDRVFERLVLESLERWVEFADRKLAASGRRLIVTSGNDDPFFVDDGFAGSRTVEQAEGRIVDLGDGHQMINVGWTNPTPWHTHRETSEEELGRMIAEQADRLGDPERAVFNLHPPPYNSGLDSVAQLDENLRPIEGGATKAAIGSTAVRRAIERYRPLLGLHGHVHEARGVAKIGRTLCLNPGSVYGQGLLAGALVDLRKGKVKGYQLVEG